MKKGTKKIAIFLVLFFATFAYSAEVFWLRGTDEMIGLENKKEYALLEIKPNENSTETEIKFISEGKEAEIAAFYRKPLKKDITISGPATLWISKVKTGGKPKIKFGIIDYNTENGRETIVAESEWKEVQDKLPFESTVNFEPYNLKGENMLKLVIHAQAQKGEEIILALDKRGEENITWISRNDTEISLEKIEGTGALLINAEGLPEIKCKSSYECSDGNVMTVDICYFPGTYSSYCGNEYGECKVNCYQDEDCKEFENGVCESAGTCTSRCVYGYNEKSIAIKIIQPDKEEYKKGSFVKVAAKLTDFKGEKVLGASMVAETDKGIVVQMREVEPGLFESFFQIPNRIQTGNMKITFKATKEELFGIEQATIKVMPPKISIYFEANRKRDIGNATLIITKSKDYFEIGEKIELIAKAFYENGEPIITDSAYATIQGQIVKLFPKERGVYSAEYTLYETQENELTIKVSIDDGFNNIAEQESKIMLSKNSFLNFIIENSTGIVILIFVFSIAIIIIGKITNKAKEAALLIKKEKDLIEKIKELQTKYYVKRIIDKKTYEKEMGFLEPQLNETREKLKKTKNMLRILE